MLEDSTYSLRELLADVGGFASIISLILTSIIFFTLRSIRNSYIFRIRSPQFIKFLATKTSELNELAREFSANSKQIVDELAKIDVRLGRMQGRMSGSAKKAIMDLRERIEVYEKFPDDEEKFNQVNRWMQRVIEEVKELQQDLNLE